MKLYYASGACSLAAIITAEEAALQLAPVNLPETPHALGDSSDFRTVNPTLRLTLATWTLATSSNSGQTKSHDFRKR